MAKALGLYVIGTDVSATRDTVLSLGADEFGGFDTERVREKFSQTADVLIDATNGGSGGTAGIHIIKDRGIYVSLTDLPEERSRKPNVSFKRVIPSPKYLDSDAFFAISLMIRNNQLQVPIGKMQSFNLLSIKEGQQLVEDNSVDGKVIVKL